MMKKLNQLSFLIILQVFTLSVLAQNDIPELQGPYLGQNIPGIQHAKFAPGIISTPEHNEFCASFSSDGKEFYFNRGMTIMVCYLEKDVWTNPEPASFNGEYRNHEAHIAFDNKSLFFGSSRPPQAYGLWLTKRTENGWSEPKRFADGMYVTSSKEGNIYYGLETSEGTSIIKTKFIDDKLLEPEVQDIKFADPNIRHTYVFHPAIAPNESYIVFDNNHELFVCFKQKDGSWRDAVSLNKVLNAKSPVIPYISPDGKYLFFASQSDLYWVSTEIIQKLKAK